LCLVHSVHLATPLPVDEVQLLLQATQGLLSEVLGVVLVLL
jgi:hypothetical protein